MSAKDQDGVISSSESYTKETLMSKLGIASDRTFYRFLKEIGCGVKRTKYRTLISGRIFNEAIAESSA